MPVCLLFLQVKPLARLLGPPLDTAHGRGGSSMVGGGLGSATAVCTGVDAWMVGWCGRGKLEGRCCSSGMCVAVGMLPPSHGGACLW